MGELRGAGLKRFSFEKIHLSKIPEPYGRSGIGCNTERTDLVREIHYATEGISLRLCDFATLRLILNSRISIRTESLFPFVAQIRIRSEYQLAKLDGFGFLTQRSENFNAPRSGF